MKPTSLRIAIAACALSLVAWFCALAQPKPEPAKVLWMNDSLVIKTNIVDDTDRMKTNNGPSTIWFMKQVVVTNKVDPWVFRFGDKRVELGARADGVIVWREEKP